VVDWGEGCLHPNLMAEILKHVIVKLLGIVDCDHSRNPKAVDDVLLEKLLNGCGAYAGDQLQLIPLYKILDCYDGEGVIALS
jgi:hypothetical protein